MNLTNLEIVERRTLFKLCSLYYWSKGFNVTHVNGSKPLNKPAQDFKAPTHTIEDLKTQRQLYKQVNSLDWNNATGLGAVSGANFIRCIDIDGSNSPDLLKFILKELRLKEDYEWVVKTGSNNGFHIWIKVEDLPKGWEAQDNYVFWPQEVYEHFFKRIELRWNTHTMLPPSIHQSGNTYKFLNVDLPSGQPVKVDSDFVYNVLSILSKESSFESKSQVEFVEHLSIPRYCSIYEAEDKVLFLDLETTGLPAFRGADYTDLDSWPYILQAAWIQSSFNKDHIYFEKSYLLKPGCIEIEPSSVVIHGITKEFAEKNGFTREKVLKNLVEYIATSAYIVAHNAEFDINLLKCELIRIGVDVEDLFHNKQIICTMKSAVDYCKIPSKYGDYKWPSLQELYETLFGERFSGEHDAKVDVRRTYECFDSLKVRGIIKLEKASIEYKHIEGDDLPF